MAERKSSGQPRDNPVSEALSCRGPRDLEWGWRPTVQVWKFVTGVLVRMPWESCAGLCHRHCGGKDVLLGLWRLVYGTNALELACVCPTGRTPATRETVAVRRAPCTPKRARTSCTVSCYFDRGGTDGWEGDRKNMRTGSIQQAHQGSPQGENEIVQHTVKADRSNHSIPVVHRG